MKKLFRLSLLFDDVVFDDIYFESYEDAESYGVIFLNDLEVVEFDVERYSVVITPAEGVIL